MIDEDFFRDYLQMYVFQEQQILLQITENTVWSSLTVEQIQT